MILIYTEKPSPRLNYACKFIFRETIGIEYRIINNSNDFLAYVGPKLYYGNNLNGEKFPFIESVGLIFDSGINPKIKPVPCYIGDTPVIFRTGSEYSILPFDLFSAVFFMLSRYEEYLPFVADKHDRFEAQSSLLYESGLIRKPLVNIWIRLFVNKLKRYYPDLEPSQKQFDYVITFDIDSAWSYLNRGFLRNSGGYINSLKKRKGSEIIERTKVLLKLQPDPFDNFGWISDICAKYSIKPIYFFLLGQFNQFNKNISPDNYDFRKLIQSISISEQVGIHSSYDTHRNPFELKKEIGSLEKIVNRKITLSRQHFLRLKFPDTYRNLINQGINEDYSLGFAGQIGYRAGICSPFFFYDLLTEEETTLKIFPLTIMDGTLNDYLGLNPDQAIAITKTMIDEVKEFNGTFISLWHNESLSDQKRWIGWRRVFETMLIDLQ